MERIADQLKYTMRPWPRARLIASLWDTTSPEDWVLPSADWVTEANRRSDEFDAGNERGSDWSDVRQRARKAAGLED